MEQNEPTANEKSASGVVAFEPIVQMRAHEYVADQLRRHIALGLVGGGEAFPPERELARLFEVGRSTIQQAMRLLETDHLVESRRGRAGGTFVVGPPRDEFGLQRLLAELRLNRREIEETLVYRGLVERASAQLAANEAGEQELDGIAACCEGMRNASSELEFHRQDTDFHLQIARASHNRLIAEGVERSRLILNSAILAQPESDMWHERLHREHDAILEALCAHDERRAVRAMDVHTKRAAQSVRAVIAALR
jgi:DNA-binding FadR family transcriptional regulator